MVERATAQQCVALATRPNCQRNMGSPLGVPGVGEWAPMWQNFVDITNKLLPHMNRFLEPSRRYSVRSSYTWGS